MTDTSPERHVATYNIGRLHHPLDADETAEFAAAIDPINALAEATPGFVWRLQDDDGRSSSHVPIPGNDDPLLIVNFSTWSSLDALQHFVNRSGHAMYLRRRREWFERSDEVTAANWWIEPGTIPSVAEAHDRLLHLRTHGPTDRAWALHDPR